MKAIDISREAWEKNKINIFNKDLEFLIDNVSVGLVGKGSECFGYDDSYSVDHDWGIGFCIWLDEKDYKKYGENLLKNYEISLMNFETNYPLRDVYGTTPRRIGPLDSVGFYKTLLGTHYIPKTNKEWLNIRESDLASTINGTLFLNNNANFSRLREYFEAYFPEDVRNKKLSYNLFYLGQIVQYNFFRTLKRKDLILAKRMIEKSLDYLINIIYILNCEYKLYYKWELEGLKKLEILGDEAINLINIIYTNENIIKIVEEFYFPIIVKIMKILDMRVDINSLSLIDYSRKVHEQIKDNELRFSDIMRYHYGK